MSEFHVGQKVVRIKTPPINFALPIRKDIGDIAEVGEIYEVRWVGMTSFAMPPDGHKEEQLALRLVGVNRVTQHPSKPGDIVLDVPFGARLFRPLQENKIVEAAAKGLDLFRGIAQAVTEKRHVPIKGDDPSDKRKVKA